MRVDRGVLVLGCGDAHDVARDLDAKTRVAVEGLAMVTSKIAQGADVKPYVARQGVRPTALFFRKYEGGRVSMADAKCYIDTLECFQDDGGLVEDGRPVLSTVLVMRDVELRGSE